MKYLFPISIITMSPAASVVYAAQRDWRHAIYFLAGAVVTASATF